MKREKMDPTVEMEQTLQPFLRSSKQFLGRPKSMFSVVGTKLEDLAKEFSNAGHIHKIARGQAKDVAHAILTNTYKDPIAELNKHNWTSFEFNINLHLSRKNTIQAKKLDLAQPIVNFNTKFNFVHFLAITGKTKLLSQMNISDEEMLKKVQVTNVGEEVNRKDAWIFGGTALHLAAMYSPEALSLLLYTAQDKEKVMEATSLASKRGVTALHVAAMSHDPFGVHILLKHGANCDAKDSKEYTPLFYAAKSAGCEATYHLLETGSADANAKGVNGKTALFKCESYKDVLLLDNYGVDKSIQMEATEKFPEKRSALHYLVDNSYQESPMALMDCDIFKEDDDNYQMNLELPLAEEDRETLGLHKEFLKESRKDLFLHPIMEIFLYLKLRQLIPAFRFKLGNSFLLCIVFSLLGCYFTKLYDCKYVDETDEKERSLDCNHMNDHFSVAENCYYFFNHDTSWFAKNDNVTFFVNKFYGCDSKSKIVSSNLKNSDGSEMYPNGTILDIQCYKNHTLRILENGNAHTRYGVQQLLELRGKGQWSFLLHPFAILLYILLGIGILKEILDVSTLGCKVYIRQMENLFQIFIIICSIAFMIVAHFSVKWAAHLAGCAVIFMWVDFTMELGKNIGLGLYIYIVIKVTKKICTFLILYLPVFCAFAFGFYFINNQSRAYSGLFTSFLRVFVHMTGESEFTTHFQWSPVKLDGGSQFTVQCVYVACTIILTIVVSNILIAFTLESAEKLRTKGDFIGSELKVWDALSLFGSFGLSCMIRKPSELEKIGIIWKHGCKGSMDELGFWKYAWITFWYGGTVPVFAVIDPNVNKETSYYVKERIMEKLQDALKRKEQESLNLQDEIAEIRHKTSERYFKLKKQFAKFGLRTQTIYASEDEE